ncbi:SCO6880 family protein [Streptomyces bohaiensis]|uniref:SCO6880 family protein n=1 Tax=Streptomyces bohaiensis TaxID=1431344 RepID=UPI003B7AACA7
MAETPRAYGGWQTEKSAWFGELSGTGFTLVATAVLTASIPLYTGTAAAALVCLPLAALLIGAAYGRVYGLTADQWAVLAFRHHLAVARRQNVFLSGVFAPTKRSTGERPMDLPGALARLRILPAPDGRAGKIGVVHNPATNTYTGIMQVSHGGLALVDTELRNRRVDAWGGVLRAMCVEGGPIVRVAVHQRCMPDDGAALDTWTAQHIAPDAPPAAVAALTELMAGAGPSATTRETYVAITIAASRVRQDVRGAGGGQVGAAAVLVREMASTEELLAGAGLMVTNRLAPREVAGVIRSAYDPEEHVVAASRRAAAALTDWTGGQPGVPPELAGPAAAEAGWGSYRHDGAVSVTYHVTDLPRLDVLATVLQPLMRPRATARRCMTLTYEPLPPRRAKKELSRERTKRSSARTLRAKTGRVSSVDEEREDQRAVEQDVARADGQGVARMTMLCAVTVTDPAELDRACSDLQADGAKAALTLRRAWGAQDDAFAAAALPLALGLPDRRGLI